MGHSFIPRGSATTVEDCYKALTAELFAACKAGAFQTGVGLSGYPAPLSISATNNIDGFNEWPRPVSNRYMSSFSSGEGNRRLSSRFTPGEGAGRHGYPVHVEAHKNAREGGVWKRAAGVAGVLLLAAPLCLGQATTWKSDPAQSKVEFTIRHLSVSEVHGSIGQVAATIHYDASDPARSSVDATIRVATLTTGEDGRDDEIKSADFFDTDRYATATFSSTAVSKNGDGLWVRGNLTLHGVTRPVVLDVEPIDPPAQGADSHTHAAFTATATIDRTAFGIGNNYPAAVIGDQVQLQIDLKVVEQ